MRLSIKVQQCSERHTHMCTSFTIHETNRSIKLLVFPILLIVSIATFFLCPRSPISTLIFTQKTLLLTFFTDFHPFSNFCNKHRYIPGKFETNEGPCLLYVLLRLGLEYSNDWAPNKLWFGYGNVLLNNLAVAQVMNMIWGTLPSSSTCTQPQPQTCPDLTESSSNRSWENPRNCGSLPNHVSLPRNLWRFRKDL